MFRLSNSEKKRNEGQNKVSDEESEEQRQRVTKGIKHKVSKTQRQRRVKGNKAQREYDAKTAKGKGE